MNLINLLPKDRQKELLYETYLRMLYMAIAFSCLCFFTVFVVQYGVNLYLQRELISVQHTTEQLKKQLGKRDDSETKVKIKKINDQILDYKNLATVSPKWSRVIKTFVKLPPPEVRITSFSVDEARKTISISGYSPSREIVLKFYENIEADSDNFYGLEKYLENISKPTDISFKMDFFVKPEVFY
jgi:Tfp pilus assembly protein PilN